MCCGRKFSPPHSVLRMVLSKDASSPHHCAPRHTSILERSEAAPTPYAHVFDISSTNESNSLGMEILWDSTGVCMYSFIVGLIQIVQHLL